MTDLDQGAADILKVKNQVLPFDYNGIQIWAEKGEVVFDGGARSSFYRLESHVGERVLVNYGCDATVILRHRQNIDQILEGMT